MPRRASPAGLEPRAESAILPSRAPFVRRSVCARTARFYRRPVMRLVHNCRRTHRDSADSHRSRGDHLGRRRMNWSIRARFTAWYSGVVLVVLVVGAVVVALVQE